MKFYEDMHPAKRRLMLIETVQGSLALEGMKDAATEFDAEALVLKEKIGEDNLNVVSKYISVKD